MIQKAFGVERLRSIRLKSKPGKQSCFHFVIKIELHLTDEARTVWADQYIKPVIEQIITEYHFDSLRK